MISQFRKGKQRVYSDSLEAMIGSLPPEPKRYLFGLFLGDRVSVFLGMDETELAEIAGDIAEIIPFSALLGEKFCKVTPTSSFYNCLK